jgi:hypothetical protein
MMAGEYEIRPYAEARSRGCAAGNNLLPAAGERAMPSNLRTSGGREAGMPAWLASSAALWYDTRAGGQPSEGRC